MKKLWIVMLATSFATPLLAQDERAMDDNEDVLVTDSTDTRTMYYDTDRKVQVGFDFVVPYRVDDPQGREALLLGAHTELFVVPAWAVGVEAIFGLEDKGFDEDEPIYISPGMSFYGSPGRAIEPFVRADVPFLVNGDQDIGIRGGLGFMWNLGLSGLALRYSFDASYFFDAERTTLNLAHASAVFNW